MSSERDPRMEEPESEHTGKLPMMSDIKAEHDYETIRRCLRARERVCICVRKATVIRDARRATPYELTGCCVGIPQTAGDEAWADGFCLTEVSGSFVTWIEWVNVERAWPRALAPSPCPVCGALES